MNAVSENASVAAAFEASHGNANGLGEKKSDGENCTGVGKGRMTFCFLAERAGWMKFLELKNFS